MFSCCCFQIFGRHTFARLPLRPLCVTHSLTAYLSALEHRSVSQCAGTSALVTSFTPRPDPSMAQIEPCRFPSTMARRPSRQPTPTRRSSKFIAHSYNHLFGLPATGLRFFTSVAHKASMWSENTSCRPRPVGPARRQRDQSDVRKSVWSSPVLKRLSERIGIHCHTSSDNPRSAHEPIPLPAADCACSERR